jgi:hypothetical protein
MSPHKLLESIRCHRTARDLAAGLAAVACLVPGVALAQATQPSVVVVVAPDVAGAPPGVCAGCDGQYTTADALAGTADPLPALAVALLDASGTVLARQTTVPESFGRQTATFVVAAPGSFTVEVAASPGWEVCSATPLVRTVTPAEFAADGTARVGLSLWRGCAAPGSSATATVAPTDVFTVTSGGGSASPSMLAPSADGLRLPQAGVAVQSSGRLMFGLAATAVTLGLLGLAYESGFVRRS